MISNELKAQSKEHDLCADTIYTIRNRVAPLLTQRHGDRRETRRGDSVADEAERMREGVRKGFGRDVLTDSNV
jgi:hypothetical protein